MPRLGPSGAETARRAIRPPKQAGAAILATPDGYHTLLSRIASMSTKLPVRPTAFGTVMLRKNVARPVCRGLCRYQVGAHVLDDVDAVVGEQQSGAPGS